MAISLYSATIPSYLQTLEAISGLLVKAEAFCGEQQLPAQKIIGARLAEDMQPFAYQVKEATVHSWDAIEGVRRGVFSPNREASPDSFPALRERVDKALVALREVDASEVDGFMGRDMRFAVAEYNVSIDFLAEDFLLSFSLPNFYFHATTVYDILRWQGMPIGKRDFLAGFARNADPMHLPPFLLDHWLARFEFANPPIRYNLASSAGPRWTHGQLLDLDKDNLRGRLSELPVSYGPPEGDLALREEIARLHGVEPDWVIVTTGASEALLIVLCLAAENGAGVALPNPGYPATETFAKAWGLTVQYYDIRREDGFSLDAARVLKSVDASTKLAVVNSPHNPTGAVMSHAQVRQLAQELAGRGIPLVSDEVFHHVYFGEAQVSAAGIDNVIQIGDMSKSLSLSGLRIGWLIDADAKRRKRILDARSYFTISSAPLMEAFATVGLRSSERLISRLRTVTATNLKRLEGFVEQHADFLGWVKPRGGTLAFPWLKGGHDSRPLCEAFAKAGVLVAPGDCYGMPSYLRVGYGNCEPADFEQAVTIMSKVIKSHA